MRFHRVKITQGDKDLTVMVGRKRKQGKRERNGRIQRERPEDPKIIALNQPHRASVPADKRHDQRAENPFGRLNLINAVPDIEYDAGIKFRDIYVRYRATIDSPSPYPRAISLDRLLKGPRQPIDPEEATRRKTQWRLSLNALGSDREKIVLNSVLIYEKNLDQGDLQYLRVGLKNLVAHYGLTAGGKSSMSTKQARLP
jgi:hypothetical protein